MEFVIGQRWVSQAEPQLGLGIVVETDGRHITLHYPACEEDRMYAANNAPLARVVYQAGDTLHNTEQSSFVVKAVEELKGLQYYLTENGEGDEQIIPESRLSGIIQLSSPTQRLFSGQFDKNRAFQLRAASLHFRFQLQKSEARGLLGPRTSLLPHQVYIAHEVASRFAPRVLLADEVGLGKTIEAGMILHYQLQTGLASRALIVVPEPLLHQWLVEMLRKFNLGFSLFDRTRYDALLESGEDNPFETEQLILCSLDLLCSDEQIASHATRAGWDMLIVDEAHHLHWSPDAEHSTEYQVIEALSQHCAGLLLLTATPEQVGMESHFARLRLLDPARFHDLDHFKQEQQQFVALNTIVSALQNNQALITEQRQQLAQDFDIPATILDQTDDNAELTRQLLDRHGTGRILFRNTRAAIKNFPARVHSAHPLEKPDNYAADCGLYPELALINAGQDWLKTDPRVDWLLKLLKTLQQEKVLLICANTQTAIDLEKYLHLNAGVRSTAFYEQLSIIERDRAAAYFADEEYGAQVMICSEIGSEGRNFQFAHHLVLFDLPTNPDLLEQRIGRLDRIGQSQDIQIHIPYIASSAQEYLYRWYHQGLNSIEKSFSAGLSVYETFAPRLQQWLGTAPASTDESFETLLNETKTHADALRNELENGRDKLLELNSCNPQLATSLIDTINSSERSDVLASYMNMMFDMYGIEQDYHSENSLVLRPTEQMLTAQFPGVKDEGVTITFDRHKAQSREDMEFITWEHPMVSESMELVLGSELGNVAIGAIKLKSLPAGTVLLECFFAMQCSAPKQLQMQRYLPATPLRILLDNKGNDLTQTIKHTQLNQLRSHVKRSSRLAVIKQLKPDLEQMLANAQQRAAEKAQPLIETARDNATTFLQAELTRLSELQKINRTVRDIELSFLTEQLDQVVAHIDQSSAELQAIRVIINT